VHFGLNFNPEDFRGVSEFLNAGGAFSPAALMGINAQTASPVVPRSLPLPAPIITRDVREENLVEEVSPQIEIEAPILPRLTDTPLEQPAISAGGVTRAGLQTTVDPIVAIAGVGAVIVAAIISRL